MNSRAPSKVVFISAGMEKPKKRDNLLSRRQQYLNYGALTLASILDESGVPALLVHGGHSNPSVFANELTVRNLLDSKTPLLISIQSFYALSWTQAFTQEIKRLNPNKKIILGGRWVVGSNSLWLKNKFPHVDETIGGVAETTIGRVVNDISGPLIATTSSHQNKHIPNLNHRLIDSFREYQPSVEASRGCGMGCTFCEERDIPLTPLKVPKLLSQHMDELAYQYDDGSIRPYVQSSFFAPNKKWSSDFAKARADAKQVIQWRCESRVDTISKEALAALAAGGLKVIDLGLETASPDQILSMRKGKDPDRYLRRASDLIRSCRDHGVWVKANVLIYAGETEKSLDETISWLDEHSDCIKGVSVGPAMVFGSPENTREYIAEIVEAGGSLVSLVDLERTGIGQIHPSSSISSNDAELLSLDISRRYMKQNDYFDLKSFSYYPRSYTYSDFLSDVDNNGLTNLPFRFEKMEGVNSKVRSLP